ncbi:hypothetical protein 1 [Hubei sobemo-like virus 36]|uniref:hypothetical protein 1 n=1 Tax=Hubei sobemo-like virus 36 TaxID=1923223 RepID=UPI000909B7DF|nr:hypothetical protein 1 [Hubei sobemo-like virus 36]APG75831.1 hypothetical protein 1 [Hubei sobemo-like virus 36]
MPLHVYRQAVPDILIGKNGSYFEISNAPMIESDSVTDLCYVTVKPQIFSQLKTSIARFPKGMVEGFVSAVGRSGASQGSLEKAASRGIVIYNGSTKPGYSGAAYLIGNQIYGMHIGHSSGANVGISHVVLQYDLNKYKYHVTVDKEGSVTFSSPGMMGSKEEDLTRVYDGKWSADEFLRERKGLKSWNDIKLDDKALWANEFESTLRSLPPDVLKFVVDRAGAELQKSNITVQGQSDDEIPVDIHIYSPQQQESLSQRVTNLEARVSKLEQKKAPKQGPVQKVTVFKCLQCDSTSTTRLAVANHMITKHQVPEESLDLGAILAMEKEVKPEGVLSSDESDLVGNGKVFRNRSLSPPKKSSNSKSSSSPSRKPNRFQQSAQNQKNMENLMNKLNENLLKLVQNLPGPSSAQGQK